MVVATLERMRLDYPSETVGRSLILQADCFEWLARIDPGSLHAFVTDPPYGVKEFDADQILKRNNGHGGIWRIPPAFDGHQRAPLPRFTALSSKERRALSGFFFRWGQLAERTLVPGGHVIIASNAFLSQQVFSALAESGLEFRCEVIRLVKTLRGGDRPKNAEAEFPGVVSLPRGCYEPWGVFRKPLPPGMTVGDCLRAYGTGGLRRRADGSPFQDVIVSERTPRPERDLMKHPSAKPQSFMRQIVHAALPLGEGIICDPFMGAGATIAAAESLGLSCIGVEKNEEFYQASRNAIPQLVGMTPVSPSHEVAGDKPGDGAQAELL